MTIDLALQYIPKRMEELGYGNSYHLRLRHLVIAPLAVVDFSAHHQLFLLIEETDEIRVESDTGIYDTAETNVNELTYEHQGQIKVTNTSLLVNRIRFIQIIPK